MIIVLAFEMATLTPSAWANDPERPNVLWISCEDISSHLGCYGAKDAITPTLDALAAEGVRFTHAFTTCPVCATNRSSVITGMYPTTIGTHLMRCSAKLPEHIRCFPEYLREAGYYCTNDAKTDYNFTHRGESWDLNGRGAHWRRRPEGKPFFHVRNYVNTHESRIWPRGEKFAKQTSHLQATDRRDPTKLTLPPYYPDTARVRRDWANYHENITEMDYRVAELLNELEQDGLRENTIIFFWSDHGVGLPRGKRWLYDSGTRVPLFVVIPEKYRFAEQAQPGSVTGELVSFVDLTPTVLNLCGVTIPAHMQGRPFLGKDRGTPREHIISTRDRMDERYDLIRAVRDSRWRYTRNYMPWKPYIQWLGYAETNTTMQDLRKSRAEGTLPAPARLFMSDSKPIEELYDTQNDPHEINNLALSTDPQHMAVLSRMRASLKQWQHETFDLGFVPEPELTAGEDALGSRYAILRQGDGLTRLNGLRAMAAAAGNSEQATLIAGLESEDAGVRYWATLGLGELSRKPASPSSVHTSAAPDWLAILRRAGSDDSTIVRVAAASYLCQLGDTQEGLAILAEAIQDENDWVRLTAAIALDELDEIASPIRQKMQAALNTDRQGYFRRVLPWAVRGSGPPREDD